jgi:hypothetical protein
MANTSCFKVTFGENSIPPDGTEYNFIGPADEFRDGGAITVTAIPRTGTPGANLYMEVVQMATRQEPKFGALPDYFLDIVVRNNSHANAESDSTITSYDVYVSCVAP